MMNFEEGFRRIGIAIICLSALAGLVAAMVGGLMAGMLVAVANLAASYLLLLLTAYVIKGFLKETDKPENKE
ncbi:MAG TPA: hypothetical protein VMX13_02250 [Sedimentisphaerales bacterium]|jgi:hypothetical protein|nr:hypothetical protein [Sedimentisphaerales bacterium]